MNTVFALLLCADLEPKSEPKSHTKNMVRAPPPPREPGGEARDYCGAGRHPPGGADRPP